MAIGLSARTAHFDPRSLRYRLYGGSRAAFATPPRDAVTFWGQACLYLDFGGVGVVTDPVFDRGYSPLSHRLVGAPDREHYAGARLILLSHAHADHLSPRTLAGFPEDALILCPGRSARYLRRLRHEVRTISPWEECRAGDLVVHAVPAEHASGRYAVRPCSDGGALGFVVSHGTRAVYYSGDTRYIDVFREVRRRYAPKLAVLNVNMHLPGYRALRAARELGARRVIPAHHGAYLSPTSPANAGWRRVLAAGIGRAYAELPVGGSLLMDSCLDN
jgi:L-ascorbate metabolism protein UlaG (beta-lactamase superfamily)